MSEDLIKKSDAIGAITNHCENECYYRVDNWCPQCQREEFEKAINAIPSADRPQEWIPCSERLPKKNDYYLIQITNRDGSGLHMMVAWYQNDHFFTDGIAVAWMPLPKPWKGTDDDG